MAAPTATRLRALAHTTTTQGRPLAITRVAPSGATTTILTHAATPAQLAHHRAALRGHLDERNQRLRTFATTFGIAAKLALAAVTANPLLALSAARRLALRERQASTPPWSEP